MSKGKTILKVSLVCLAGVILWFMGWLLYAILDLWQVITPTMFQNLLSIGFGLSALIGVVVVLKSKTSAPNVSEHRDRDPATQGQPELTKLREEFNILKAKVDDFHAFLPTMEARAENAETEEKAREKREDELETKEEAMATREKEMKKRKETLDAREKTIKKREEATAQ